MPRNLCTHQGTFSVACFRVTLDLREPPDLMVRRAREDPLVSSVLLDLLVLVDLE